MQTLNREQRFAVEHDKGACLVVAGPGTGKTKTLTMRVLHLVEKGVDPKSILLMTFTRKAAEEIRQRLTAINKVCASVRAGTFHSVAIQIIRAYGKMENFRLVDENEDKDELLLYAMSVFQTECPVNEDALYDEYKCKGRHLICDTDGIYAQYLDNLPPESPLCGLTPAEAFPKLFEGFDTRKRKSGILSFDDCIVVATELLRGPARKFARSLVYICVDEYQDSNVDQIAFVKALAVNGNIFVVGDDRQSIYGWRGAHHKVFDDFRADFPGREISLVQNYRSTPAIINVVNDAAANRPTASPALVATRKDVKAQPYMFYGDMDERVKQSVSIIQKHPKNIAVLFRSHNQTSLALQGELTALRIPYILIGGKKFTESKLFKAFRALVRIMSMPNWSLPWKTLLVLFPKIGPVKAAQAAQMLENARNLPGVLSLLGQIATSTMVFKKPDKAFHGPLSFFARLNHMDMEELGRKYIGPLAALIAGVPPENIPEEWFWRSGDVARGARGSDMLCNTLVKGEKIGKLLMDLCKKHRTPEAWLDAVNFEENMGSEENPDMLVLSTVHGAKGKEWDTVILPEVLEGAMPSGRVRKYDRQGFETPEFVEERNIFYVALSRARERLVVMSEEHALSQFLQELKEDSLPLRELRS